uniref:Uncharacterized protein n=1 Tax=Rhizophora mucronata TaxID=61149 RepID=A0A2P2JPC8_RHIMU
MPNKQLATIKTMAQLLWTEDNKNYYFIITQFLINMK